MKVGGAKTWSPTTDSISEFDCFHCVSFLGLNDWLTRVRDEGISCDIFISCFPLSWLPFLTKWLDFAQDI